MRYQTNFIAALAALATLASAHPGAKAERELIDANHICEDGAKLVSQMKPTIAAAKAWDNGIWQAWTFGSLGMKIDRKIEDLTDDCKSLPIMTEYDSERVMHTLKPFALDLEHLMDAIVANPKLHIDSWLNGVVENVLPDIHGKCKSSCDGIEPKISGEANKALLGEKCGSMADAIDGAYKSYGNGNI